jgi:23S rRNA (cytosine1962-C5)-methyltransferase
MNTFSLPSIQEGEDKSSVLGNRIRKNYRHIRKWAKRTLTNCFRIYDKEIHQYPLAIDFYDGRFCIHYFAKGDDDVPAPLKEEIEGLLLKIFGGGEFYWKTRVPTRQYEKLGINKQFFTVLEYGVKFKVNLLDYVDTGLFLDHRETRQIAAGMAEGKRVLNLFAYTGSFSVHAAIKGAKSTKSVDMSNTYTDWGRDNLVLNTLSLKTNEVVRADCLKFLEEERGEYDLIIIDPPTISRSKKMEKLFDVQVDYIFLIESALQLLAKEGVILFSTNSRKFHFDTERFPRSKIMEISHKTLPIDFHDPKIHRCWKITSL